jgi:hypothetical protein
MEELPELRRLAENTRTFRDKQQGRQQSEPLEWLNLSWDDRGSCLQVYVNPQT